MALDGKLALLPIGMAALTSAYVEILTTLNLQPKKDRRLDRWLPLRDET